MAIVGLSACVKQPDYPIEPHIEFKSLASNIIYAHPPPATDITDTITLSFTDGDGDFGPPSYQTDSGTVFDCTNHSLDSGIINSPTYNVFWYTYRGGDSCIDRIYTASIPNDGKYKAISGDVQFFPKIACSPSGNTDTIFYSIFIKDRAGHISNRVRSTKVVVYCN